MNLRVHLLFLFVEYSIDIDFQQCKIEQLEVKTNLFRCYKEKCPDQRNKTKSGNFTINRAVKN